MTGEEKQTSCESETCTVQATFILKCDRRGVDLVAYRNTETFNQTHSGWFGDLTATRDEYF